MSEFLNKFKEYTLTSPAFKTATFILSTVLAGILASAFVVEISPSNVLNWEQFYKTRSFYGIVILAILLYIYNRASYLHEKNIEKNIMKFRDRDYCIAYMRSECLPELAKKTRRNIREGSGGELKQAIDEMNKALR